MTYYDYKGRRCCNQCRKLVFADEWDAKGVARDARSRGIFLRAYYEYRCGYYHLTSQSLRPHAAAQRMRLPSETPSEQREALKQRQQMTSKGCFKALLAVPVLPYLITYWLCWLWLNINRRISIALGVLVQITVVDIACFFILGTAPVWSIIRDIFSGSV